MRKIGKSEKTKKKICEKKKKRKKKEISGSGTGCTQPREYKLRSYLIEK
jgi:hypothetical protein